ncbi:NAD-dependent epimerase/dehydratase family protein [Cellulomonas humilata]|uniref:NAD-dependent epimerase/dehydratase family protein n=1 Tax=Cellulomonas humilata TaxID=144055 RepID=A0A7Y6A1L1_9CELL|nr:NAD-dependent epimerase/dehydratase family protein [Cellulomonas humilata]NUU17205.1 NAD-dependent epimerase/dehydratase family protein [Cellulomonas humilata]
MSRHVIVGKGAVGTTLAHLLADQGADVLVLSRSGGTPSGRITHATVDATDADALAAAVRGADVLYNCASPAYHRWPTDWPPLWASLLDAASRTGAVLVTAGNLYGYATHGAVMTEDSPLDSTDTKGAVRAQMWRDAEARHRAGDVRVTEVRGADYVGPLADSQALAGPRFLDPLLAGKVVRPVVAVDQPHSWSYLPDFARALVAAGATPAAWGHGWHVPTAEPLTLRELGERFAVGGPAPRIRPIPAAVVRALGLVSPLLREVAAVSDHFTQPYVMDTAASSRMLGFVATPWDDAIAETLGRTVVGGRA